MECTESASSPVTNIKEWMNSPETRLQSANATLHNVTMQFDVLPSSKTDYFAFATYHARHAKNLYGCRDSDSLVGYEEWLRRNILFGCWTTTGRGLCRSRCENKRSETDRVNFSETHDYQARWRTEALRSGTVGSSKKKALCYSCAHPSIQFSSHEKH